MTNAFVTSCLVVVTSFLCRQHTRVAKGGNTQRQYVYEHVRSSIQLLKLQDSYDSSVKKMQGWGFVYLSSPLYNPYLFAVPLHSSRWHQRFPWESACVEMCSFMSLMVICREKPIVLIQVMLLLIST